MKLYKLTIHVDILPEFYWIVATDPTAAIIAFLDEKRGVYRYKEEGIKNIEIVAIDKLIIQK